MSEESHEAGKVKQKESILVILGNPPYSGHSANSNDWTEELLKKDTDGAKSFYEVDGKSIGEKNPKWLQDDYVKFLRFSQWKIHKAGKGILGMITNHSYLDNPTFRGMRQSLMNTFNEIYIIDLHGNSKKKETSLDGSKDENVFDIQQGVSIAIMVKKENAKVCKVYHRDIFGEREIKYNWLEKTLFKTKDYTVLKPSSPWYFFIKRDTKLIEHYNDWIKVNEIFPVNSVGIVTARDEFVISYDKKALENRIRQFRNLKFESEFLESAYGLKSSNEWNLEIARKESAGEKDYERNYREILYRLFDKRYIYYSSSIIERMRYEVMQHMLKDNLALLTCRQIGLNEWQHSFISAALTDDSCLSNKTKERTYFFPLYLYPPVERKKKSLQGMILFEPESDYGKEKRPNIATKVFESLQKAYNKKPTPEQIFYYCYAILYSNIYREKYAAFLKIDFPRIPFTTDYKLFLQSAKLGEELTELHLLKHKDLNSATKYFGKGDSDKIEKPLYNADEQRVYINESRYFDNISNDVWNYQIGGYHVMEKYLKDRKGREMDDPAHYCKMATAINKTIEVQKEIDMLFANIENDVITF